MLRSDDCVECVENNVYRVREGSVRRLIGQFFPYATYEVSAKIEDGEVGFRFTLPDEQAEIKASGTALRYLCGDHKEELPLPYLNELTMIVSCRPGAFDVYFRKNGKAE